MIWGAFALLALAGIIAFAIIAGRIAEWVVHTDKLSDRTVALKDLVDEGRLALMVQKQQEAKPEPLPSLPACLCGSVDLLLMNGYLRTRIVSCQRCGKVFGVDAAGVRFDRHAEAWPEYMSQARMRELAAAEMKRTMERAKSPEKRLGREVLERPSA